MSEVMSETLRIQLIAMCAPRDTAATVDNLMHSLTAFEQANEVERLGDATLQTGRNLDNPLRPISFVLWADYEIDAGLKRRCEQTELQADFSAITQVLLMTPESDHHARALLHQEAGQLADQIEALEKVDEK